MKGTVLDEAALVMSDQDNVATALIDVSAGTDVPRPSGGEADAITIEDDIPFGHKFALAKIPEGEDVYKYGEVIGVASRDIDAGKWVHTHNCDSKRGRGDVSDSKREAKS